ncbi:MAG TPA: transcriptional repressor LexA [Kiritimatiellia bacterium]|nr:transcriptional repressor LexA [Kiritimatiellia bacterium]HPJ57384.1 transcriptional repressor LexA [Kiritimatiellia bacterium]HPR68551.1 transcriptional repressor LexA [Kiritimatiellia bacterium]HRX06288.1 transcriptional repressor LexA [Kiritimatiellia bacterium]
MPRVLDLESRIRQLRRFWRDERRAPTFAEMLDLFGYRSKNAVFGVLNRLEEHGYVIKDANGRLALLPKLTGTVRLLGSIAAGFPTQEEQQDAEAITLDDYLVKNPDNTFMLTVRGDSMIDAGIMPGDLVLVEKGPRPNLNDIVVARVDDEWTLKYYMRDKAGVRLDPANPKYHFIRPKHSLEIGGIVRAVIRKY